MMPTVFDVMSAPGPKAKAKGKARAKAKKVVNRNASVFGALEPIEVEQAPLAGPAPVPVAESKVDDPKPNPASTTKKRLRREDAQQEIQKKFRENTTQAERGLLNAVTEQNMLQDIQNKIYENRESKDGKCFTAQFYKSLKQEHLFGYSSTIYHGFRAPLAVMSAASVAERLNGYEDGTTDPDRSELDAIVGLCNGLGKQAPKERCAITAAVFQHIQSFPSGYVVRALSGDDHQRGKHFALAVDRELCGPKKVKLGSHETAVNILSDDDVNETFKYVLSANGVPWSTFMADLKSNKTLSEVEAHLYKKIGFASALFGSTLEGLEKLKAEEMFEASVIALLDGDENGVPTESRLSEFITESAKKYKNGLNNMVDLSFMDSKFESGYAVSSSRAYEVLEKKIRHTVVCALRFRHKRFLKQTFVDRCFSKVKEELEKLGNVDRDVVMVSNSDVTPGNSMNFMPTAEADSGNGFRVSKDVGPDVKSSVGTADAKVLPKVTLLGSTSFRSTVCATLENKTTTFTAFYDQAQGLFTGEAEMGEADLLIWTHGRNEAINNFEAICLEFISSCKSDDAGCVPKLQELGKRLPLRFLELGKRFGQIVYSLRVCYGLASSPVPDLLVPDRDASRFATLLRNNLMRVRLGYKSKIKLARDVTNLQQALIKDEVYDKKLALLACYCWAMDAAAASVMGSLIQENKERKQKETLNVKKAPKRKQNPTQRAVGADALSKFEVGSSDDENHIADDAGEEGFEEDEVGDGGDEI